MTLCLVFHMEKEPRNIYRESVNIEEEVSSGLGFREGVVAILKNRYNRDS